MRRIDALKIKATAVAEERAQVARDELRRRKQKEEDLGASLVPEILRLAWLAMEEAADKGERQASVVLLAHESKRPPFGHMRDAASRSLAHAANIAALGLRQEGVNAEVSSYPDSGDDPAGMTWSSLSLELYF